MTIDHGEIVPYPSGGMCKDGDALLALVNGEGHCAALAEQENKAHRQPPDYVSWASLEVEYPVVDEQGALVQGSYVMTMPETYYPTIWCRKSKRVRGVVYPKRQARVSSGHDPSLMV